VAWQVVFAAGGPRERGRSYGAAARDRVHGTVALYEGIFEAYAGLRWPQVRDRAGRFVEAIDAYEVEILPEIEGIAEGAGLEAEDVLAANLRTEIMFGLDTRPRQAALKECTALGVGGSAPLVAQTWDWKPGARETVVLLACAPHRGPGFVTMVEAGLLAKCGMNDAGIGLATNALQSSLDRGEPGVPFHAILRRVLMSASFEEAREAIVGGPRASSANYLIGDATGQVADLEVIPGGSDGVYEPEVAVHANHFLRPSPRPFKDVGRLDGEDSLQRQARGQDALAGGIGSVAQMQQALASHDGAPMSVCAHGGDPDPVMDYVTVAAMVADLGSGVLHAAEGNPCTQPFETFVLSDLLTRARAA